MLVGSTPTLVTFVVGNLYKPLYATGILGGGQIQDIGDRDVKINAKGGDVQVTKRMHSSFR